MPIFESTFGGQKKRYNIPADKVEEFKGKRPDAVEITNKPEPIETIGFGVRRAGEVTRLGAEAEPVDRERAAAATIPQWPEKPGERTRKGIADYESALKKTNELLKNPNLTPEQRQDILYQFKIAYGTLNPDDNPRITQDARAYLEQEGAGDVISQWKSLGNVISLDRGWDISGRLKDLGAGLGLTQDPATMIREREKVKNYLGKTAAGQRDVRAEQEYLAHLDRLEKELEEKIRAFEKEKIAGRRPKSDYAEMIQASVGAIPFGSHSEEDKAAIPVSDSYEKDAAILETAKRELKKIRDTKERFFDAKNKGRFRQMLGEIYRRGDDTISETATLGVRGSLAEKEKNLALKDGEGNIAREASELAMETERMYEHDATISQMIIGGGMVSIPYMTEFAVTRGAAKLLKPATAARITKLASKGGLKAAAKIAYHNANLAATMTVLQPSTYARAYEMANENAVVNGTPAGGGLDFLGKAITEQFITNASESAGDVFGSLRVKNAGGKVSRWKNVRKQVANITGLHGIPSEFMEEKTEEVGQALTGVGDTTWADVVNPKRNVIMLGTVTFSQLPVQTITAMGYAAGKANNALTIRSIRKGYNRNASNMVDVFGDESKEAMETVESFVASYGNSQEAVKAFDQAIIESDEYTDVEKSAMLNYAMSYAPMVGVDKEARARADGYVAKATGAIEQSVNKDMDAVVTVRMDKNTAVVVGGKIVQKEDGSIDKENSDATIYYRDENGKIHPIGIEAVDEVVESVSHADAIQQVSDAVSEHVGKSTANAQSVQRAVGDEIAFMVDGTSVVGVGVIQAMDEAGNYVVAMPDGTVSTIEPRQLVDEDVARMENGDMILYTDADGTKKKGVVADSFNYQGEGLIVLEDGTKVPFASILGVLEEEKQEAMGETVDAPSEGASTDESPSEVEETPASQEEVDAYADFPRKKSGEIDSAKLTDDQALVYAEREHGKEFAVESARVAIDALNKKRKEVESKMRTEGNVAKRADMQSQIKGIDKRIGVYQEYLENHEKAQDSAPSEEETPDVKKEEVQENIPENDLSLPKENEENSKSSTDEQSSKTELDNGRAVEGSVVETPLGKSEEGGGIARTIEAAYRGGSISPDVSAEEREELESRGIDPYWDRPLFLSNLKSEAQKNGVWVEDSYLSDKTLIHDQKATGTSENDIYLHPEGDHVSKLNNLSYVSGVGHAKNLLSLFDRISAHNHLFPNVPYTVKGFMSNNHGRPSLVLEQPYVRDAERNATQDEIDEYLSQIGFKKDGVREWSNGHEVWSNGVYELFDARPANVLKGRDGSLYFIDTYPHSVAYMNQGELNAKKVPPSESEAEQDVRPDESYKELEAEVGRLSELFHTPVQVHYSPDTIQNATARKAAEDGLAKGWYVDGEVHIYLPNATGVEDIQETFFHEVVAHKGVKEMLGDKHSELMDALFDVLPESEQKRLLELYGEKHIAADEYLAELAERGGFESKESRGIISKIVDAIREFLSRYHIRIGSPTAEEIANSLLKESAARLTEKRKEADAPKFNGDILAYARDLHKRNQLREAAKDVETNPSRAQQEAGNYKKAHVNVQGFDITIENPKGSTRSGVDESGKEWSITMQNDYGYFKRSEGKDGDQIDVFIGNNPESGKIFVVDQVNPETGVFDESKVMLGFNSEEEAKNAYLSNYEKGWQGLGAITETNAEYFKEWLYDGKKQRKAFSEYAEVIGRYFDELKSFQKKTDMENRTSIDKEGYIPEDLYAPLLLDGMPSKLGVETRIPDKITDPSYQVASYDYSDEIDQNTNEGWQKWSDLSDQYNASVDDNLKAWDIGDTARFGFKSVDAAVRFSDWVKSRAEDKEVVRKSSKDVLLSEEEYLDRELVAYYNSRDIKIPFDEWRDSEDSMEAENALLDSYADYVESLSESGALQRIWDSAKLGDRIKIRKSVEAAGFNIHDMLDTKGAEEKPGPSASNGRPTRGVTTIRFYDGAIIRGDILSRKDGKVAISSSTGRYTVTEDREMPDYTGEEDVRFRGVSVNDRFNEELAKQVDGTLPRGHVYRLGMPGDALRSAGLPDLPIEMAASRLANKSNQENHPFDLSEVKDLPDAIQHPLAVFRSATRTGSYVVMTEIKQGDKNFVAAIEANRGMGKIEINSIRSLHPRTTTNVLSWINEGLLNYADKKKLTDWVGEKIKTRSYLNSGTPADVRKQLVSAAKVIEGFENPKPSEENIDKPVYYAGKSILDYTSEIDAWNRKQKEKGDDIRFRLSDELQSIKERAISDGTFMKAPNGRPTKLNEHQWLQVRTDAFKKWFGDWEKSARIEKLRKAKPVEITGEEVEPSDDLKQYKKNALEYGKTLRGEYTNKDTGEKIAIGKRGVKEVLQHDYKDREHLQSIAAIPQIIENSIYIDTLPNEDVDKNPDVKAYQYYVSGLKIGGEDYTARAAIAVDSQGNRYYDHKLTDIEKGGLLNAMVGITNPVSQKTSPPSGYKDTKLVSLLQTNSSKVVDENGEPLVVYHGTREDGFSIFDDMEGNKLSDAPEGVSFFTDMKSVAYTYSGRYDRPHYELEEDEEGVGSIYEVFLNIRNPRFENFGGAGWDGQAWGKAALLDEENIEVYPNNGRRFFDSLSEAEDFAQEYDYQNYYVQKDPSVGYTTNEIAEEAMADGNDGAIFYDVVDVGSYGAEQESTVYVTFHPSQIKSATDNTGAFDEKNNDIRFRLDDAPIIDTEDLKKGIRRENRFQRTMDKFQEAYQDTYLPVKRLYERIEAQGVKVEDWENFYAQATHIPGKNQAEIEVYTSKYMNPMIEQIKVLQDKGFSFREIENYVMLKHGMERNEYMRERESAKYLKKHPRATAAKIDELKSKDYAGVRDIAKEVGELGDIPEIGTAERIAAKFVHDVEVLCGDEAIGSFWDAVTAATRFSLTKSYHSGILSKAGYDELISRYKYYVPLRGHDAITAEDKWDYISESGSPTFSSPIKRAKGRSTRAESPFAFIFQTAQSSIMAGNKNRLKSTLLNLAESGKAGALFNISKSWYEKAGTDEQGNDAWQLAVPKYDEDPVVYSENIVNFEKRMKEEAKKGNAVQSRRKLDLDGMFIKPHQAAEHEIHIRRNGEDLVLYVNADPALARSVNGANRVISDSRFMHGARWSTRQIAATSTSLNPLFTASNFMRDLQYSVVKLGAEKGGKFTAGYSVRLGRILFKDRVLTRMLDGQLDLSKKYDQYAYEFLMNGGKTGYVSALNLETTAHRIEKELKRLGVRELSALNPAKEAYLAGQCTRAMGDFFVMSNEIAENSIRLAAYITARERGESIVSSVNTAKEVTVNFNRRGSGAMGADAINSLFMFTNVAFQALDNFAKIAKIANKHKWKIAATMAAYMLSGFLQSWWIDVFGSDDSKEAYWGTSDWDRQNNLCIPIGRGLLRIPHPQELRALRGLGVGIYQSIKGTKTPEDTVLDLLSAIADVVPMGSTFVPAEASVSGVATAVSPTVLQPVTQWVANMNFKGNPVRNAYAPGYAPGHLQARTNRKGQPRADRWIYDLCEFINVSVGRGDGAKKGWIDLNPDAVQHFAGGYFGGLFNTASSTVNTIYMTQNGEAVRELRIRDTPLRRFYAETADMNNVDSGTMSKFYDISDKARATKYRARQYKKQLTEGKLSFNAYRTRLTDMDYPFWWAVSQRLGAIRNLEKRLGEASPEEQTKLLRETARLKKTLVHDVERRKKAG